MCAIARAVAIDRHLDPGQPHAHTLRRISRYVTAQWHFYSGRCGSVPLDVLTLDCFCCIIRVATVIATWMLQTKVYTTSPLYPNGRTLRDYQVEGLNWMVRALNQTL
jgi:hypothetical protein